MKETIRRLLTQSGAYALGNMAIKASGFILAIFYLDPAYLPQADFGYLAQLDALARLLLLFVGLGLPLGLIKYAAATDLPEGEKEAVPSTALFLASISAIVILGMGWVAAPLVAGAILDNPERLEIIRLLTTYIALKTVADVGYAELRARERPGLFVRGVVIEWLLLIGCAVYFLAIKEEGLLGVMKGYAISATIVGIGLGYWTWRASGRTIQLGLAKKLVMFGAPMVAAGLASRFLSIGDRFLIDPLMSPEAVGVYEWASKLGGVLNMFFVQSFQLAFTVIGLKTLASERNDASLHRRVFRHYSIWTGWAALGLTLFASDVTRIISDQSVYIFVEPEVLLIALGFLMNGLYFIAVNVLYSGGKTKTVAISVACAAVLNIVLNLLLIPIMGLNGAALATFASYAGLAGWTAIIAERDIKAGYPWHVLLVVLLFVGGLWAVAQPSAAWDFVPRAGTRLLLLGAYPALVVFAGLYSKDDLRQLKEFAGGFVRREHD